MSHYRGLHVRQGGRLVCLVAGGCVFVAGGVIAQGQSVHPWPQYGQNERNNCRSPYRMPDEMPCLGWWAPLGMAGAPHFGGAAIATLNDGTETTDLYSSARLAITTFASFGMSR